MPTSAGKTLLAKFTIVQTKALNPNGTIAYVVPTRVLVNQVTLDLRADFRDLNLSVEQAVPAFELDPTEEKLLNDPPDVLVTTPEKLDLLVRRDHPATRNLALIIADEAHNIRDLTRGPRLELLLGTIKRDRAGARFLLLSPFLPNDDELVRWLGDDRYLPPISINWRPGRRIVGAVSLERQKRNTYQLIFETLNAAHNTDVDPGIKIPLNQSPRVTVTNSISSLTRATILSMIDRGAVLVYCRTRSDATKRALEVANLLPQIQHTQDLIAVCKYIDAEMGYSSTLVQCLRHGVAYHHAGLSHEVRWLIEDLIRRGVVNVICGTTTLAQGVNFPIRTVIVETLKKGRADLTYQDFWNIAGRAGRTLVDTFGLVAFPTPNNDHRVKYERFLASEAQEISSQLIALIEQADNLAGKFDLQTMRDYPQLSTLFQFLAHAMRVSGSNNIADEVEDLLRASLVFYQAQRKGNDYVQQLLRICRLYLNQIKGRREILSVLPLADKTGFATPSVMILLQRKSKNQELSTVSNWHPERLFGDDLRPLRERIEAIAELPEIQLGRGERRPFSAHKIAEILRDWVRGESLYQLAEKHSIPKRAANNEDNPEDLLAEFSTYLFSKLLGLASWGIGALESVCLVGKEQDQEDEIGYIPSMIYFGVRHKEAVWLRMVGVPRVFANDLAQLWKQNKKTAPVSYDEIRSWIASLDSAAWERVIPSQSALNPDDMKVLWEKFTG